MNISKRSITVYNSGGVLIMFDGQNTFVDFISNGTQYTCAGSWTVQGEHSVSDAQLVAEDRSEFLHRMAA